ncbi:MAG: bifunctional phosphoribosylaminoimidazolecarboxamide formyltransferase/IMP cyclohydrolase [Candidatus Kaiserbacteria bacterium]|nr:bifunctional phosphoribosylaminoimidazolecarboxamide formyltransferase/IMP cyclohydrolase [Candidatus Kaiserbacteria bacterium]
MTRVTPADFPDELTLKLKKIADLRYGENPQQSAAVYGAADSVPGIAQAKQLQGKELSYNNIQDADAALECVAEFDEGACVILKHMNPCGVALGASPLDAYRKAYACDTTSPFGGIVAFNRALDKEAAEEIGKIFIEVIIAPEINADALAVFSSKPNVRMLECAVPDKRAKTIVLKTVGGGYLAQTRDAIVVDPNAKPKVVTKREPTAAEWRDMKFAFEVVKHLKSNAIVYARDGATVGIGAGQTSRIYAAKIAAIKASDAGISLKNSVMASDAFFPFSDTVDAAHEAGASAIVQPGGSIRDQESIDKANEYGMAMIFTSVRHFRH